MNRIAVVYLSYVPFGIQYLINFIDSYRNKVSGESHELIILFNGFLSQSELIPFFEILNKFEISCQAIETNSRFDIDAYFYVASKLNKFESLLFFNTYSIIQNNNWLSFFYRNLNKKSVGCVSASGTWGDNSHLVDYKLSIKKILSFKFDLKDIKKAIFFRFNFYPQVKSHLRTNAFMIRRDLFLSTYKPKVRPIFLSFIFGLNDKKISSFCFEHGNNSFSNQLLNRGFQLLVVDKYGIGHDIHNWKSSETFWIGSQKNLLIHDNQTLKYELSNSEIKRKLTYAAWGN